MNTARPRIPYTYEDYKSLPASMDRRYELLQGELYTVPAPTTVHQRIALNVEIILALHVRRNALGEVFHSPVDVVFGAGQQRQVAQPDVVFISAGRGDIVTREEIAGPPDLVVEILSPGTEERDRNY